MSLFGATQGVNPKTGSYLSAEERVQMFKAATGRTGFAGRSGGSSGSGGGGGGAIVATTKMTSVVQTLQTNFQSSTTAVAEQVQQNRQSVENLYKVISNDKQLEAAQEREETKDARITRENRLRAARENLIEGLSKATAGLFIAGKKAADAVMKPIMGLWDRIKRALLTLLGLWALDNLPFLINSLEEFVDKFKDLGKLFQDNITGIRGVWSILDRLVRGIWKPVRKIIGVVADVATWIGKKAISIGKKVFGAISDFLGKVISGAMDALKKSMSNLWDAAKRFFNVGGDAAEAVPDAAKASSAAVNATGETAEAISDARRGSQFLPEDEPARPQLEKGKVKKNWFQTQLDGLGDKFKSMFGSQKKMTKEGAEAAGAMAPEAPGSVKRKLFDGMSDFLKPLLDMIPAGSKNAIKGIIRTIAGILGNIPVIGIGIDYLLNSLEGVPWKENLIRSIASGITGDLGAMGGAALGAAMGTPFGGIGAIPGAFIGAILGGMAGGFAGDRGAKVVMQAIGMETTNTSTDSIIDGAANLVGIDYGQPGSASNPNPPEPVISGMSPKILGSTPTGMSMENIEEMGGFNYVELPPQFSNMFDGVDIKTPLPTPSEGVEGIPEITPFNLETSYYTDLAAEMFELAV